MTQNPSLVCAKSPHHVRVKIHRVWRRAESILCDKQQRGPNPLSCRSMFGSTCELCLALVAMEAAIDGRNPNMLLDAPHPGSAWNGQAAGSTGGCTTGTAHVVGRMRRRAGVPCDRLHAADSLGKIAWNEGFQAPEESLGLGLGEISAWPCAVM